VSILARKRRRDFLRRSGQYLAVTATVAVGVTLFAASFDAFQNLSASYEHTYDRLAFADLTIAGGDTDTIESAVTADAGVAATHTRSVIDVPLTFDNAQLFGRLVGMPTSGQPPVNQVDVLEGRYLEPGDGETAAMVVRQTAEHFDLAPGDTVDVSVAAGTVRLDIVGVVTSPEYLWLARSRQEIFTTADGFSVLFVAEELAAAAGPTVEDQVVARYRDASRTEEIDARLTAAARSGGSSDVEIRDDQPSNAALREDLDALGKMSFLFPMLFLGAAGMAAFILLSRIVSAERAQIGTMRANGIGARAILRHYLGYGITVGVVGAGLGILVGAGIGAAITSIYTDALGIPDTVRRFYVLTAVIGLVFGVVMGALAAWAPARRAMAVAPAEAMRGEIPRQTSSVSLVERLVPPLRRLPARWRMTLRGLGRSKRRSVSTVLGVVLAIVLILASWGMVDTVADSIDRQFNQIQANDAQLVPDEPLDQDLLDRVAAIDGVASVEPAATLAVTIAGADAYATQLTAYRPDTTMRDFGGEPLPNDGIVAGAAIVDLIGASVGEPVRLTVPAYDVEVTTELAGVVDEPFGTSAYVSIDHAAELLAQHDLGIELLAVPGVGLVLVDYEQGVDRDQMRLELGAQHGVGAFVDSRAVFDVVQGFLGLFYALVGVMVVFGGLMAFALMFNTTAINIAERSGELATLRANGLTSREAAQMVSAENLILTLIGIPFGLALGTMAADGLMSSFNSDLFSFELAIRPSSYVSVTLAILLIAGLALWPGLRAMRRLDIAEVTRERS